MIVVSRGSLDGVYPGLILANGARMEGIEASMFFTFFGLNALIKKTMNKLKISTVGNSALNMAMPMLGLPITLPFPTWMGSIPGVSAFATYLMKRKMAKLDIPPVGEFLELISDSGGKIYGCKLAMDMFDLTLNDLWERNDGILTVEDFYGQSAGEGTKIIFT